MEAAPIIPYRNILVIQTGFVGDMVLTTPLLRELRRAAPEAAIALLHAPRTAGIVRRSPHIDDRIVFDKRGSERGARASARLARDLRRRRFDLVISAHRSLRSGWLALATGAGRRIGFDHPPSAVFYTDTVPYSRWESTFVRRKLRLLEPLGIEAKDERTEAYFNEEDAAAAEDLLRASSVHPPFAVLALGSAWPTKRWPGVRFGELAAILARRGMQSVLVGGAEDAGAADEAARAGPAVDWTGRTSLARRPLRRERLGRPPPRVRRGDPGGRPLRADRPRAVSFRREGPRRSKRRAVRPLLRPRLARVPPRELDLPSRNRRGPDRARGGTVVGRSRAPPGAGRISRCVRRGRRSLMQKRSP